MTPKPLATRQELALAPVRGALLRSATAQAAQILADARDTAAALLEQARGDAANLISQAQAEGQALAAPLARAEISRGHREARAAVLRTELRARGELEHRIESAIMALKDEPGYGELRDGLAGLALRAAGPGATVREHPAGGVVARAPGVLVDCSLPRLAQQVIEALGPQVSEVGAA